MIGLLVGAIIGFLAGLAVGQKQGREEGYPQAYQAGRNSRKPQIRAYLAKLDEKGRQVAILHLGDGEGLD